MIHQDTNDPESTSTQSPNLLDTAYDLDPNIFQDLEYQHGSDPDNLMNNMNDLIEKYQPSKQNCRMNAIKQPSSRLLSQKTIKENKNTFDARLARLENS